ncbi:MAG: hypothetical protein QXP70_05475 [Methanomassiliicoccales archaeon]
MVYLSTSSNIGLLTTQLKEEIDRLGKEIENAIKIVMDMGNGITPNEGFHETAYADNREKEIADSLYSRDNTATQMTIKESIAEERSGQKIVTKPPAIRSIETGGRVKYMLRVHGGKTLLDNGQRDDGCSVCPSCGARVDSKLVVCVQCGEFLTGRDR